MYGQAFDWGPAISFPRLIIIIILVVVFFYLSSSVQSAVTSRLRGSCTNADANACFHPRYPFKRHDMMVNDRARPCDYLN